MLMRMLCTEARIFNVTFRAEEKRQGENWGREAAMCERGDQEPASSTGAPSGKQKNEYPRLNMSLLQ